jgi:SAM-dependent methyltransferase
LDLGFTPLADAFLTADLLNHPEVFYPLKVNVCQKCGLSQLSFIVDPQILYQRNYPYESSTTKTGRDHFYAMAARITDRFKLTQDDHAIDVGSNVGVLLTGFKMKGVQVLGVDPATDMAKIANDNGIKTIATFFSEKTVEEILKECPVAKVITGTNVFAHINDLDDFMKAVDRILDKDGVLVIEAPHFLELVNHLEYDTIYHEHLSYLAAKPMQIFFRRFGFELFDVEKYPIHGGTLRYFACRKGVYPMEDNVRRVIFEEEQQGIFDLQKLLEFARKVYKHKQYLIDFLRALRAKGKRIVGISAPAKGNTLLNYCHMDRDLMEYITEKAQVKVGKYTPGTLIPVVEDARLIQDMPDYAVILAWNFAEEIMKNLSAYKEKGGHFIIPIPHPHII